MKSIIIIIIDIIMIIIIIMIIPISTAIGIVECVGVVIDVVSCGGFGRISVSCAKKCTTKAMGLYIICC